MERRGADKYSAAFVQKTYKDLEAAGKADLGATDGGGSSSAASSSKDTDGAKLAEGPKTSGGAKKTARVKKTAGAKEITEANDDVVVKEEETADGDNA